MPDTNANISNACGPDCGCSPISLPRRGFLALTGLTLLAGALEAWPRPVMAGPFEASDFAALIPPDKKLDPKWVQSLFARGEREVYTKKRGELRYIGMPVGGLCCGTLYLGGDGKLWLWDIFNQNQEGVVPQNVEWVNFSGQHSSVPPRDGASYVGPRLEQSPLEQGFALRVNGVTRQLDASGWDEVAFMGEYPIGTVKYTDPNCPVTVTMTAYSPFIPLNADDSGTAGDDLRVRIDQPQRQACDGGTGRLAGKCVQPAHGAAWRRQPRQRRAESCRSDPGRFSL